ncbi:hypothetical protein TC41_0440 [Alicyclobacillus acidocaldarius subsp. acidocaldarius Tc-4-1]|uniref:Uncharacterized protein n=1 Tax=Alicyclobacillus acidocaldarius (strain Tc-4-1) TaxID=1048834 RepID=F8IL26_ALIAT|nr:hypothetical protein TC41_0440 [Alicyclobacillus acidocaldarius subsp. acidocaldarius Tc-4-1]
MWPRAMQEVGASDAALHRALGTRFAKLRESNTPRPHV